ncbi:Large subunit GTPase 1 like [Schistosoma japonicum]|nr:Large subunit GTPase 1 like [Schistosoma japonicum]
MSLPWFHDAVSREFSKSKPHFRRRAVTGIVRPKWNTEMSADALDNLEKEEFLKWRRTLSLLEEKDGIVLTPFERNLEFWRQLWRVVERSDVVVQVVDARQPLLYYSDDLETYIREVDSNKSSIVLVNKSDFLTYEQRRVNSENMGCFLCFIGLSLWSVYFKNVGINAIFWSAVLANEQTIENSSSNVTKPCNISTKTVSETSLKSESNCEKTETDSDTDSEASTVTVCNETNEKSFDIVCTTQVSNRKSNVFDCIIDIKETDAIIPVVASSSVKSDVIDAEATIQSYSQDDEAELVGVEKLIDLLTTKFSPLNRQSKDPLTIGFIGYPNVGKSSTLNAILGHKKVAVSVTPGKTKHFQTIYVRSDLILCDCPGLVMPSFAYSRADLVVAGILSIDGMRDYLSPIGLVCERIPRCILETMYGINLPQSQNTKMSDGSSCVPTPHELLAAHAFMHGFMTAKGNPNYDRSARIILKDYVKGKLLYCHPPPNIANPTDFQSVGRDNGLPCGVGYFSDQSKADRFLKRFDEKQKKTPSECVDEIVTEFDRLAFKQGQNAREHIKSHKQLPILRSNMEKSNIDCNDDEVSSNSSWSTVASSETISNLSCISSGTTQIIVEDGAVKKPWRLLSHAKHLNSVHSTVVSNQTGAIISVKNHKKRKEKLRRVYRYLDEHERTQKDDIKDSSEFLERLNAAKDNHPSGSALYQDNNYFSPVVFPDPLFDWEALKISVNARRQAERFNFDKIMDLKKQIDSIHEQITAAKQKRVLLCNQYSQNIQNSDEIKIAACAVRNEQKSLELSLKNLDCEYQNDSLQLPNVIHSLTPVNTTGSEIVIKSYNKSDHFNKELFWSNLADDCYNEIIGTYYTGRLAQIEYTHMEKVNDYWLSRMDQGQLTNYPVHLSDIVRGPALEATSWPNMKSAIRLRPSKGDMLFVEDPNTKLGNWFVNPYTTDYLVGSGSLAAFSGNFLSIHRILCFIKLISSQIHLCASSPKDLFMPSTVRTLNVLFRITISILELTKDLDQCETGFHVLVDELCRFWQHYQPGWSFKLTYTEASNLYPCEMLRATLYSDMKTPNNNSISIPVSVFAKCA